MELIFVAKAVSLVQVIIWLLPISLPKVSRNFIIISFLIVLDQNPLRCRLKGYKTVRELVCGKANILEYNAVPLDN
jgi:hypothetical protein